MYHIHSGTAETGTPQLMLIMPIWSTRYYGGSWLTKYHDLTHTINCLRSRSKNCKSLESTTKAAESNVLEGTFLSPISFYNYVDNLSEQRSRNEDLVCIRLQLYTKKLEDWNREWRVKIISQEVFSPKSSFHRTVSYLNKEAYRKCYVK